MSVATITRQELEAQVARQVYDLMQAADIDDLRSIYNSASREREDFAAKLQEISVSCGIIHYMALKGRAEKSLSLSLSHLIRNAVHGLLERDVCGEFGTYKELLTDLLGRAPCVAQRDYAELTAYEDVLTTDQVGDLCDGVDIVASKRVEEGKSIELSCTINVSVSRPVIVLIKILCKLKIYVSQSEFLRRAISDYLQTCVWCGIVPDRYGFYERR